jgi:hypothetical protein
MLSEKQRSGALMLGLLGFGGTGIYASRMPSLTPVPVIALALAVITLCLSPESRKKPSLRYASVIFVIFLPLAAYLHEAQAVCAALVRFWPVMVLLISVAMFRQSVNRSGLADAICKRLLKKSHPAGNTVRVSLASAVLTVLSGQGSIAVICTALSQRVKNRLAIATITNRALGASMYVLPTTIASASVASAIPHLDTASVMLLGAPLMVFALLGSMLPRLELIPLEGDDQGAAPSGSACELAAVVLLSGTLAFYLAGQMTIAFAVAMGIGYLYDIMFISKKRTASAVGSELIKNLDTVTPELLLLAASGLLILAVGGLHIPAHFPGVFAWLAQSPLASLVVLVVALPLVTAAGVHPLILFGTLFPVLTPGLTGNTAVQYLAWSSMFVMANLVSPVSICSIVAATSLKQTTQDTSYRSHGKFCAVLAAVTIVYLTGFMAWEG